MQRLQLCTMAQKLHTLTHAEKQNKTKQLINPAALHSGFERDGESSTARVEESSLSLCSDEEPALAKCSGGQFDSAAASAEPRPSLFPHCALKETLITFPSVESHRRCYAHQAKTNRCNTRPKIIHLLKGSYITPLHRCVSGLELRLRAEFMQICSISLRHKDHLLLQKLEPELL